GAILCEILTGQPPFAGHDISEILTQSATGNLEQPFARLDRCRADAELIALAKRCLAAEPEARPQTGAEVAAQRGAVPAGGTGGELERTAAEARATEAVARTRAERRARYLTLGLTVSVLLGAVVATLFALRAARQAEAEHLARAEAEKRLVQITRANEILGS